MRIKKTYKKKLEPNIEIYCTWLKCLISNIRMQYELNVLQEIFFEINLNNIF